MDLQGIDVGFVLLKICSIRGYRRIISMGAHKRSHFFTQKYAYGHAHRLVTHGIVTISIDDSRRAVDFELCVSFNRSRGLDACVWPGSVRLKTGSLSARF